jgi:pimeloyl-ACP methyl ester carboxylesterase
LSNTLSSGGSSVQRIHIGGIDLVVEEQGQGESVLLVHGFPLDRRQWRGQSAALAGVRLLIPDLRGFGDSEPAPPPYPMIALAEDLRQILDHLAIERVVLGGLSMGGYVALAFAERYPERLRALMLLDTHPRADTPEARRGRSELAARVRRHGVEAAVEELAERLLGERDVDPEVRALTVRMMLDTSVDGMVGALEGMAARPDSTSTLPQIRCPTLVLVGSDDAITPPSMAREMAAAIPGAELVEIPGAGHLAPLERPAEVNAALEHFLARALAPPD